MSRDTLLQFLVKSMVLSLLGGLIGEALGRCISSLMGQIEFSGSTITQVVGLDRVPMATYFSLAIGLAEQTYFG